VTAAGIGVFGGSGFASLLESAEKITVDTPFGAPSAPIAISEVGGRRVAFLPRHGERHQFVPHAIPAKANLWAMRAIGARQLIGPCAAGSLRPSIVPGDFVVLDQLVDRTFGRPDTYYDQGVAHHVSFADPYCAAMAPFALRAGEHAGVRMHDRGTVVVVNGPRFSTRAESRWYRSAGWDVVNMTQYPEAYLARELGLHYCGIALVTDFDTGVEDDPRVEPVSQAEVFAVLEQNVERARALLTALVPQLPAVLDGCACETAIGPLEYGDPQ
jgi:5'-methylthioadenosine phosphorylase